MGLTGLMMLLVLSGGNELLDYVGTEAYWQACGEQPDAAALLGAIRPGRKPKDISKLVADLGASSYKVREAASAKLKSMGPAVLGELRKAAAASDDEEVKARVGALEVHFGGRGTQDLRRLMAIRTLGERKVTPAATVLKALLKSPEPFVAEFAARAIARIEGQPVAPRPQATVAEMKQDLHLLPADCSVVGQINVAALLGLPHNVTKATTQMAAGMPRGRDPKELAQRMTGMLLEVAGITGNFRLQAATVGVSGKIGKNTGYVMIVGRGRYDAERFRQWLKDKGVRTVEADGVIAYMPDREVRLIVPSDRRLILLIGSRKANFPLAEVVAALKKAPGKPRYGQAVAKLVAGVDTTRPVWAVAAMTASYREALSLLAPLDWLALTGVFEKDVLALTLTGAGQDAEKVAAAVAEFNRHMAKARQSVDRQAERMPAMKVLAEVFAGVKATADGKAVTASCRIRSRGRALLVLPLLGVSGRSPAAGGQAARQVQQRRIVEVSVKAVVPKKK